MTIWRYNLRQSKDLSMIGELTDATGKSLALAHNTPGTANWTYPMSAEYSPVIQPYNTCISAERYNWRATKILNNAQIPGQVWDWIWSGYVLPLKEDWTNDRMQVSCVGWAQRLAVRMIRRDMSFVNADDALIYADLLAEVNLANIPYNDGSTYAVPTVVGSNPATPTWLAWGGTQPNEGPGGATAYVSRHAMGAPLTVSKDKFQMVLPIWNELSNLEAGPDWWVDPKTRSVYLYRKKCTVRDTVLAYQWGPNNLAEFGRDIAADQKVNFHLTTGKTGTAPGYAHNPADQAVNGLIDGLTQLNDISNTDYLIRNSGAEIILRKDGRITYSITPFVYVGDIDIPQNAVPEPFVDYDPVWDELNMQAVHPVRGTIPMGVVRCYGVNVNISDQGNREQLSALQVAP